MRRLYGLVAVLGLVAIGASGLHAQQANSPESSLWFNQNIGKTFPIQALAGSIDPNLIVVEGVPNALYKVDVGRYVAPHYGEERIRRSSIDPLTNGISHIARNSVLLSYSGRLDSGGQAIITVPPGTLVESQSLAVQAIVGGVYSGATKFNVVETMSAVPELRMGDGSVANILGPITSITSGSIFVGNLEYVLTGKTIFGNTPLAALQVGNWVDMVGEVTAAGGLRAIEVNEEDPSNEVRIRARVQGIGPSGFCLLNVTVFTSNATQFVDWETGVPLMYGDIELSMPVEIRIATSPVGFPFVTSCELNVEIEPEPEPEPEKENEDPPPPFCS